MAQYTACAEAEGHANGTAAWRVCSAKLGRIGWGSQLILKGMYDGQIASYTDIFKAGTMCIMSYNYWSTKPAEALAFGKAHILPRDPLSSGQFSFLETRKGRSHSPYRKPEIPAPRDGDTAPDPVSKSSRSAESDEGPTTTPPNQMTVMPGSPGRPASVIVVGGSSKAAIKLTKSMLDPGLVADMRAFFQRFGTEEYSRASAEEHYCV